MTLFRGFICLLVAIFLYVVSPKDNITLAIAAIFGSVSVFYFCAAAKGQ